MALAFFVRGKDLHILISRLEHHSDLAIAWFRSNYMKSYLIVSR